VVHQAFHFLFTDELGQCLLDLLGIHYASCVVDTNVLLRDISWTLKKQRASSLILAARVGTLRLYASTQVRGEVPKKIRARASSFKMDPEAACQLWKTTYRPLIRFLDPGELCAQSKQLEELRHRDSDDLPTAQLIELLRPTIVFSEDQDLAAFGHHPDSCVLVELSQEVDLREYYRHRMFWLHSSIKTRRELCLYPRSVPHRHQKRQKGSHRTIPCQMRRNFANACETLQEVLCGS
jgi:hypothetical protein